MTRQSRRSIARLLCAADTVADDLMADARGDQYGVLCTSLQAQNSQAQNGARPASLTAERIMRKTPERKRKTKRTITRAVTHIPLIEANPGKLEALNRVATAYISLCQQYVTLFCTDQEPNMKGSQSLRCASKQEQ